MGDPRARAPQAGIATDKADKTDGQDDLTPALNKVARDLGMTGREDLLVSIGSGTSGPSTVAQKLALAYLQQRHPTDDIAALVKELLNQNYLHLVLDYILTNLNNLHQDNKFH